MRIISTISNADGIERTPTIPYDLPAIEAAIRDVNAALFILDPLVATLDQETNSYRDQDIRRALAPVAALAERTGVAVICIRHLNKGGSQNPKYRGGGSIGIIGAARAAFLFGDVPGRDGTHAMAPTKGNLWRRKPQALEYTIEERNDQPVIVWHGESQCTAVSLLAQPESAEESNACVEAQKFLVEILRDGEIDSKDVIREARAAGVSEKTLHRAKHQLGVRSQKHGIGKGQHWVGVLPKMVNDQNLTTFEESTEITPVNSTNSLKKVKTEDMTIFAPEDGHLPESGALPLADDSSDDEGEIRLE